jgi:hypothetical protein
MILGEKALKYLRRTHYALACLSVAATVGYLGYGAYDLGLFCFLFSAYCGWAACEFRGAK